AGRTRWLARRTWWLARWTWILKSTIKSFFYAKFVYFHLYSKDIMKTAKKFCEVRILSVK
ncbi:hypothetical protein TU49_22015, partial [Bacillus cereus]